MKVVCPGCEAKYQIADDKVAGRTVKLKCRKCGAAIEVDGQALDAPPPTRPSAAPPPAELASIPPGPAAPGPAPSAPTRPDGVALPAPRPAAAPRAPAPRAPSPPPTPPTRGPVAAPAHRAAPPPRPRAVDTPARAFESVGATALAAPLASESPAAPPSAREPPPRSVPPAPAIAAPPPLPTAPPSRAVWFLGLGGEAAGPLEAGELATRAEAAPAHEPPLVWRAGFADWRPVTEVPEFAGVRLAARPAPPPLPVVLPWESEGAPSALAGVGDGTAAPSTRSTSALEGAGLVSAGPSRGVMVAAVLASGLLGLAVGFVVFGGAPPPPPVATAAPRATSTLTDVALAPPPPPPPVVEAAPSAAVSVARVPGPLPRATGEAVDLAGLGAPGADERPSGGAPPAGAALDGKVIQQTVARYQAGVRQLCWQPALEARDPSAPSSARVMVTLTVGASGAVESATTSGDPPGYRGLASCIGGRVRGWQFPASGAGTTVNVPFVFVAQ